MDIQVLISTMNQKNYDLLDKMKIASDTVVINQCNENSKKEFKWNNYRIMWINTTERGLSRSRNMALRNSQADICILADDDEEFRENYVKIITRAFNDNPNYQILRFKINGIEKSFKEYPDKSFKIGFFKSLKISSVEIAFKRDEILKHYIEFDPLIGSGTKFPMGEENSFLFQCLKKGLKIKYLPETTADLHIGKSTWFRGYNKEYFLGRGAAFTSMSKMLAPFLIVQFAIRKKKLYIADFPVRTAIKCMFQGRKEYIQICK